MPRIKLTRGLLAEVDACDLMWLSNWKWQAKKSKYGFYATRGEWQEGKKRTILMHREILGRLGILEGEHRDGNGLNNRRANLRPATRSQNLANRRRLPIWNGRPKSADFRGVRVRRGRIESRISVAGLTVYLGGFDSQVAAAQRYDAAARLVFGAFARLNFPSVYDELPKEIAAKLNKQKQK